MEHDSFLLGNVHINRFFLLYGISSVTFGSSETSEMSVVCAGTNLCSWKISAFSGYIPVDKKTFWAFFNVAASLNKQATW